MARKNNNARKRYTIDYGRFAKSIGLNPVQRVKTLHFILKNLSKGGVKVK